MEKNLKKKSYTVLMAATGINFISAILYVWSVISKALVTELGWTNKEASLPYTILSICFVIAMVIIGKIVDSKGPTIPAMLGNTLIGIGVLLSGLTKSPTIMILTMGVLVGAGSGIVNVSTTATGVKWFPPEKKGMVTGIVVAGVGISSAFYSPLSNYLINTVGISKSFIYLGIFVLLTGVPLASLVKNPPKGFNFGEIKEGNIKIENNQSKDYDWKYMLRDPYFYKLWMMLGLSASAGLMIMSHISNIAKIQVNWEAGFILVILISMFNTLGRFLGGYISDKIGRLNLVRILFIMQGINMFAFTRYSNLYLISLGVAVAGLCYGGVFSIFPAMVSDAYGSKNYGMNYGVLFTAWGAGGIIGPMTAASLLDALGSYNYAYIVGGILVTIAIGITFTVKDNKNIIS